MADIDPMIKNGRTKRVETEMRLVDHMKHFEQFHHAELTCERAEQP